MDRLLKVLFFAVLVKPIILFVLGLNVRNGRRLPLSGPAVIAANHNSHLDTMVLMSLYPLSKIHRVRPVAAADYFLSNRLLSWFSLRCIGIIPLDRTGQAAQEQMFDTCARALDEGDILILFPEGSRGEPEQMKPLKKGLYHLIAGRDDTKVVPVAMHGLGRALPRGEALLVPFNCDVVIGEALPQARDANEFVQTLGDTLNELLQACLTRRDVELESDQEQDEDSGPS